MNDWLVRIKRGLISLVNDNHADNSLKEVLVYKNGDRASQWHAIENTNTLVVFEHLALAREIGTNTIVMLHMDRVYHKCCSQP